MRMGSAHSERVKEGSRSRVFHKKGQQRREEILDAAEVVFADHGYFGASLREIADVAGANIGLINYYFRNKESLCGAVLERRRSAFVFTIIDSLQTARAQPDASIPSIIRAYIEPILALHEGEDAGWRNYVRLTARFMLATDQREIKQAMAALEASAQYFMASLRAIAPEMCDEHFYTAMYVVEATLTYMLQDPTLLDRRSSGIHSISNLTAFLEHLVPVLGAGFRNA